LTGRRTPPARGSALALLPTQEPGKKWLDYSSVGLMFPASILVGFAIGFFLDKWLKTDPWLKIVFILYGIVAGFTNLFSQTRRNEPKK
jgi:F0F1-type ATP synthase assembly protein I